MAQASLEVVKKQEQSVLEFELPEFKLACAIFFTHFFYFFFQFFFFFVNFK